MAAASTVSSTHVLLLLSLQTRPTLSAQDQAYGDELYMQHGMAEQYLNIWWSDLCRWLRWQSAGLLETTGPCIDRHIMSHRHVNMSYYVWSIWNIKHWSGSRSWSSNQEASLTSSWHIQINAGCDLEKKKEGDSKRKEVFVVLFLLFGLPQWSIWFKARWLRFFCFSAMIWWPCEQ